MTDKIVLNRRQKEAVEHSKGPLLIVAGAGTGKTTVITERIKHLIDSDIAKPSEILALTFTQKAAREMEERVDIALPYGYTQMWISTFHAFCDRVLRQEALQIGLSTKYKLTTEAETIQFVRVNLFKFKLNYFRPLGNPTKFIAGMLRHFSRLKDEDVNPKEYLKFAKRMAVKKKKSKEEKLEAEKTLELATAFQTYEELKVKEGIMDFADLIGKTLKLFRKRPNVLKEYQRKFKHVLVDEFQDTNIAQNELVILLAGKNGNISVVADDDQSIYKWRGAAVSNVIQFRKSFPKSKVVTLIQNYRSSQEILDKAYDLIQHNNPDRLEIVEKINKKLIAQRKKALGKLQFIHKDRVENESEEVVKKILEITTSGKYDYKDIAILVRANNHAQPFMRALSRHAVPYQFLGPGRLFRQPEVMDLISYLKVLYDFEDSVALYRLLSIRQFDISAKDLIKIGNLGRRTNLSLYEACERSGGLGISDKTHKKITSLIKIIAKNLKRVRSETAGQLLYDFLEDSGLLKKMLDPQTEKAERRAVNISKLFDKLKSYEADHEDASVTAVIDWIELMSELGESPLAADLDWSEINAVNLLTIHSSKGLEFPVVFLVNLVSQRFPTRQRREQIPIPVSLIKEVLPSGDYHEQEERRLFYVGMTRARDLLVFTGAKYYGEGKREKKLSPFIFEALGDDAVIAEKPTSHRQLSFIDYAQAPQSSTLNPQPLAFHIDYLSYSQLETFKICPLHYKLKYILNISPPPSAALSFGAAMHEALKEFYLRIKQSKKPARKHMEEALKANWISEGFMSKSHERKMFERGEKFLTSYLKKEFDAKNLPVAVEQPFVIPLRSAKREERPLKIGGKIDRVDELTERKIEIIDYKTGAKVPTQKQVDHNLQLTMYALAATGIKEYPFEKKPEDVLLTLYYFNNQKRISTTRTVGELREAQEELFEWRKKIETSDFSCSKHIFCRNCEFALMCREEG